MKYVEGTNRYQPTMLPPILDDYVDENNPARVIDAFVDSLNLAEMGFNKTELQQTGRPPYSPYVLLKLYIYGYFNKIRSSRKLEAETYRNVEVMWLLENLKPDHKTISRFRKDNLNEIKKVFDTFVKLCLKLNLYGRELVSIDGSQFAAVNSKDRNFSIDKLKDRIERINNHISEYLSEIENNDKDEKQADDKANISQIISDLQSRKSKYEGMIETLKETGEKQISLTDPDSRLMTKLNSHKMAYNVQTGVDSKNALIVDFVVSNKPDRGQMYATASTCKETLEVDKLTTLADKGYVSFHDIADCISDDITANVCMDDNSADFCIETNEDCELPTSHTNGKSVYLKNRNICVCPMGKILYPNSYRKNRGIAKFYNHEACKNCTCKCTTGLYNVAELTIPKEKFTKEYNDKNLKIKQIHYIPDKQLLKKRKCLSEHPFGIVKRCLGADYLLMKRFSGVIAEMSFAFLAFNLKRAINIIGAKELIRQISLA